MQEEDSQNYNDSNGSYQSEISEYQSDNIQSSQNNIEEEEDLKDNDQIQEQSNEDFSEQIDQQIESAMNNNSQEEDSDQNIQEDKDYYQDFIPQNVDSEQQPPLLVVVQGASKTGKSTLINSLISCYMNIKINNIEGCVTVNTSKTHRITFIEYLSKVADLSLVMIDASRGFDMETYEYLCLAKQMGLTNTIGILTHLDYFKDNKLQRKTRKKYKSRFQVECGNDSKLFYFQGIQNNNLYPSKDVQNLARMLSVMKRNSNEFQNQNPHILVDRFMDFNDHIEFYGYIRGCSMYKREKIFLVGQQNYKIIHQEEITDPVQIEIVQKNSNVKKGVNNNQQSQFVQGQRSLKRKRNIYAPYTNLSFVNMDQSGGFINIPDQYVVFTKKEFESEEPEQGVKMVRDLHEVNKDFNQEDDDLQLVEGINLKIQEQYQDNNIKKLAELQRKENKIMEFQTSNQNLEDLIYKDPTYFDIDDNGFIDIESINLDTINTKDIVSKYEEDEIDQEEYDIEQLLNQDNILKLGSYVKIIVKKEENNFNLTHTDSIILASVLNQPMKLIKSRIKKHRWYGNILKSKDPLIISCGWYKYQTIPYYCTDDMNIRTRFIKYTPEHEFCKVVFYGIQTSLNQNIVCFQTLKNNVKKFRVAAQGTILQFSDEFSIKKKLKLIGEPYKIYKNTAFIKNMFTSKLEVMKFLNAKIRTVSGIRGEIKKWSTEFEGSFRAAFEDKIILSDIVFLRTYLDIEIKKYVQLIKYNQNQRLIRTTWELKQDFKFNLDQKKDSKYYNIERKEKVFNKLIVPKSIQQNLPYKNKQKIQQLDIQQRMSKNLQVPIKTMMDDQEKEAFKLIQRLNTIKREKEKIRQINTTQKTKIKNARREGMFKEKNKLKEEFKKEQKKKRYIRKQKNDKDK